MGTGFKIKCKKCGYEREFSLGVGFLYPQVYKQTIEEINEGKFGEEYKELMQKHPDSEVDISTYIYYCPKYYKYILDQDNSLYKPTDNFYEYDTLYQWKHICPKCGKEMIKMNDEEFLLNLEKEMFHCENCGATLNLEDTTKFWR